MTTPNSVKIGRLYWTVEPCTFSSISYANIHQETTLCRRLANKVAIAPPYSVVVITTQSVNLTIRIEACAVKVMLTFRCKFYII